MKQRNTKPNKISQGVSKHRNNHRCFFTACAEVVVTEELELELIRVACDPNPFFKYQLIYKAENATGMVGVYSFDEDWYYLYKQDTERYKVKRRKDLEGIEPSFTYKQQRKKQMGQLGKQKSLNGSKSSDFEAAEQTDCMRMGGM